ncbi:MAG TPA: zinc ribbon domain-containing protein [Candidatus Accumulibacter phosphatis]|nr:MAG: putative regulatory protein, FmdB family [Candidatus Accumulibacter sp. SK-11]HRL77127.1 zinc ribbon domain-containing protein [Candidatus Accumulibacter phosphatis]HRQ95468.1 zinc ribbon domain-containing protein [Candidatus Accumulibacter phosphatis]
MPIYAYRCASCGFANDHLQKLSDPALDTCPQCGQATYVKQVTAAGFQLKGSGWYVTDFKGGKTPPPSSKETPAGSKETPAASEGATAADSNKAAAQPAAAAGSTDGASTCAGN